jgi:hypothetical protein
MLRVVVFIVFVHVLFNSASGQVNIFACDGDTLYTSIVEDTILPNGSIIYKSKNDSVYLHLMSDTIGYLEQDTTFLINSNLYRWVKPGNFPSSHGFAKIVYARNYEDEFVEYDVVIQDDSVRLDFPDLFESYTWSNGDTLSYTMVDTPSNYTLNAATSCGELYTDTVAVYSDAEELFYVGDRADEDFYYFKFDTITEIECWSDCSSQYPLDLNLDGENDYLLELYSGGPMMYRDIYLKLHPLNDNKIALRNEISYHAGIFSELMDLNFAEGFEEGNVMNEKLQWTSEETFIYLWHYENWEITQRIEYELTYLNNLQDVFLCFKLKTLNEEEVFAWLNLSVNIWGGTSPPGVDLIDFAINKPLLPENGVEANDKTEMTVFPNPTSGIVYFETRISNYFLYNSMGRLVNMGKDVSMVDMSAFASGIYLLKIIVNEQVMLKQIVKK